MDRVSREERSRIMGQIRGRDTTPELFIRSLLHRAGYRFRLHDRRLPGRPDLVLRKYHAIIFVNGCFWHGHACPAGAPPVSHTEFWLPKLHRNQNNDAQNRQALATLGWRSLVVWQCALRGRRKLDSDALFEHIQRWLQSNTLSLDIPCSL